LEQTSSLGLLRLIAPIFTGVDAEELLQSEKILDQLMTIILRSEYTDNFQLPIQSELLRICRLLIEKCQQQLEPYAYRIFKCILSLLSIVENEELRQQVRSYPSLSLSKLSFCFSVNKH
jgi:hypothetical protein